MNKTVFIFITILCGASIARAQRADFSGTWILQRRISISGNDYVNGMPSKIFITQLADSIIIRKQILNQNGIDSIYTEAVAVGRVSLILLSADKIKKLDVQWMADSSQFIETVHYESRISQKVDRKITYNWKLCDGKTLTLGRQNENLINGEVWSMEGLYKKRTL